MTTYEYNALGQRTAKTVLGTTTRYAYDEQGHLLGEYTSAGSPLREYVWLADTPVLLLVHAASPPNSPPAVYFIHADQIDTPRIVQDNQYRNRWAWDPDGFGQLPPNDNPQGLGSFTFNLRMPGQFFDAESGLFYNHFRDYDPQTGRYIESDPIGLAGGVNTYAYVGGDPLRYVDPRGLFLGDPASYGAVTEAVATATGVATATVAAIVGGVAAAVFPSSIAPDPPPSSQLDYPDKERGNWICYARANCNDNIPGNCPDDPNKQFAFGSGVAKTLGVARNLAKKDATHRLACQPKHVSCKCTGPKGERYSGGC